MKISLSWMKQYGGQGLDAPIDELVARIGGQLGAVEEVESLGEKYRGAVVVKVVACELHPDSDHLRVCMVDDGGITPDIKRGDDGLVQVVCGAPNVRAEMLAVWLPPGMIVPGSVGKEPLVLEAREIRGATSNGMLASLRELALGDDHSGILELNPHDAKPGDDFAKVYQLDDHTIDIENKMFTHRPDCFGMLGVAREIAGISGQKFTSPEWYLATESELFANATNDLPLKVVNELPELVPRFTAIAMSGVDGAQISPAWLQTYLLRVGVRPINMLVDVTNYLMLATGQPLHAYDYDKLRALTAGDTAEITVRYPKAGEKIVLLNGKTIEPRDEAIMIASGDHLIGVGGVMGGADTEVSANTKNIVLECATFDMYSIRRTSMAHGLFTDAVTRFNKGQSPLQNDKILAEAARLIWQFTDKQAQTASPLVDVSEVQGRQWVHPPVPVTTQFINERLGLKLSVSEMKTLLENVEFSVVVDSDTLTVTAPFWRTDIESREDVVEEVGRLYGYDKLSLELPKRSIKPAAKDPMLECKSKVRETLARAGANEALTYSFVHGDLLKKSGQNPTDAFQVGNALSPDLQYYRLSLAPSLLEKIHPNIKAGYDEFALFEIGKGHNLRHATDDDGLPAEFEMLDLVYAHADKYWKSAPAFYEARRFLLRLVNEFGFWIEYRSFETESDDPVAGPYDYARSARVFVRGTEIELGVIGEFKASVRRVLKLPLYTAGFSVDLVKFMQAAEHPTIPWYQPIARFPSVSQDVTLQVPADLRFDDLYWFITEEARRIAPEHTRVGFPRVVDIYQAPEDTTHKRITLRLIVANYERTLTDAEVNELLNDVAAAAKTKFGADRI